MPKKKNKIKLGKTTEAGYEYSAKINFRKDFSAQIATFIQEKKASDELDLKIRKLKEIVRGFSDKNKEKNLSYYSKIGRLLSFVNSENFKDISPYSIFRRIKEEIPQILPHIEDKTAQKHLEMMYKLGQIDKKYLSKVSWDYWYEIMKFKEIYKKPRLIKRALKICKTAGAGPLLREKIKGLITTGE